MSQPLIQFRAGRAERRGETNWVDPQPNKGLIYLQEEDGLLHFYYKDLTTHSIIDDLIIFPGDATFVTPTSLSPSRISILKFSSSSSRHFYWNQELDTDGDSERTRKVNELIGGSSEEEVDGGMEVDAPAVDPAFVTPSAPRTIPTAAAASVPTPAPAPAAAELGTEAQMAQLRSILSNITGGAPGTDYQNTPPYLLTDLLSASSINSHLASPAFVAALLPHLPPQLPQNTSSLHLAINSPEFKRSLRSLERALGTGALGPLVKGLGLEEDAAMGTANFVEAIQRQGEMEKEKDSEGMQED